MDIKRCEMDDMKESSDLDVRGGLLQSMMMLFTFMGVPRFKKTSELHDAARHFQLRWGVWRLFLCALAEGCDGFFMVSLAENHLACQHGHILILEECFGLLFCFCLKRMCHWWKNIFSGYKEGGQSNQLILVVLSLVVFVASLHIFALWAYLLLYSFHKSAVLWIRH